MIYKIKLQHNLNKVQTLPNDFSDELGSCIPPDRVPKLKEIVDMFLTGRPIDATLEQHLDFVPIEDLALLKKGMDLADLPYIAKQAKKTIDECMEELDRAKLSKKQESNQVQTPPVQEPVSVSTE